jgi:anaerobic selenocysteine-containing dehydrogenase
LARWSSVEDIVHKRGVALASANRGSTFVDPLRQRELRELEGRGWWLPHGQGDEEFWRAVVASGGWFDPIVGSLDGSAVAQHPDGRVRIFPSDARARLKASGLPLAEGFLAVAAATPAAAAASPFPLQLVPFRVMTLASGSTPLTPFLLERLGVLTDSAWETWVEVDPQTARAQRLQTGQRVRVESTDGAFEATVRVFAGTQPGVVNVPYGLHTRVAGWGDARGGNPLAAVGRRIDAASGMPDWYSTRVRLVQL